jgi:hypothetical protein
MGSQSSSTMLLGKQIHAGKLLCLAVFLILFQSREGSHWEILNVNSDGGGIFALTRPLLFATIQPHHVAPAWSPDGHSNR